MWQELLNDEGIKHQLNMALLLGLMVMARVGPIIQLVPYLGGKGVPAQVKVALGLAMAALVYPALWSSGAADALPTHPAHIALLVVKEGLLGMLLGFVAALAFDAVRLAGQIMDTVRGQNMATTMVPQLPDRVSISADILYQLTLIAFVGAGAHRLFIAALVRSFVVFPPHRMPAWGDGSEAIALGLARISADAIGLGVLLAFPVIAATLLVDLCLALVNRSAPQIQVFFIGMPIKALLGVAVLLGLLDGIMSRVVLEASAGVIWIAHVIELFGQGAP
jgi:flagellar biosynthesis protein FliR